MNFPLQSTVLTSEGGVVSAGATSSMVSPLIVITALVIVLPSAGLIAVPPTSATLPAVAVTAAHKTATPSNRDVFMLLVVARHRPDAQTDCVRTVVEAKRTNG